ncbi:MAG: UDP-N-acetylmuramoyl-tripeptide--D-alanyl-D-alanine ligase [Myxococcota bacterium]
MKLDGSTIAAATGGTLVRDAAAGDIITDTRTLERGSWFLAISGDRFDGHEFLDQAQAKGAIGCVVSQPVPESWTGGAVVVPDTTRALQALGRHVRQGFEGPVVGLTGSSGKTTTRALIACAIQPLGEIHQTKGNLNNHWGVPMTFLATPETAKALVVEMGTSGPGEIELLARLSSPNVRLIVNVGPAHLEELGGLDGVKQEKGAMFATARPGDVCCVNVDDERVATIAIPDGARRLEFGGPQADTVALLEAQLIPDQLATRARYRTPEGEVEVTLPAPGRHVALNAAGALCVAIALGIDPRAAAQGLASYTPVGMRMRPERLPSGALALNDAYNANPDSMKASLSVLAAMPGKRWAVLGDMFELGPQEAQWHRQVAGQAGALGLDHVVLVGPRMAEAAAACVGPAVQAFTQPTEAATWLQGRLGPDDVILFKGSRGARLEEILRALKPEEGGGTP